MPIRNPRWLPPQVIVLTQDHMGKYRNILCINHLKVLYKLRVFYVDRNSKMTTTAGHSFYIGPIGSFYNQVNDTGSCEPLVAKKITTAVLIRRLNERCYLKIIYTLFLSFWIFTEVFSLRSPS
jgi:hypothetical protein